MAFKSVDNVVRKVHLPWPKIAFAKCLIKARLPWSAGFTTVRQIKLEFISAPERAPARVSRPGSFVLCCER